MVRATSPARPILTSRILKASAAAACLFAAGPSAAQTTYTWSGAVSANWSDTTPPTNWQGGVTPFQVPANLSSTGTLIDMTGTTQLTNTLDMNLSAYSLTFDSNASTFTVNSSNSSAFTLGTGGISITSGVAQTINAPIALAAPQSWTNTGNGTTTGLLTVGGAVTTGANALTLAGGGNITFTSAGSLNLGGGGLTNTNTGTVSLAGAITLSAANTILNSATTGTFTIGGTIAAGGNALTFDGAGSTTASGIISGTAGLTKNGTGILTLSGANTYTGQTIINAGTLKAGAVNALGSTGGTGNETIVQSGATFDVNGIALNTAQIFEIAGTGVGGNGALVDNGATQQNALNHVLLTADATVGAANRFDIRVGTAPTLDLAGHTLTKIGTSQFSQVNTAITAGNIVINAGIDSIEGSSTVPAGVTITVNASGTLALYGNTPGSNFVGTIAGNGGTISNLGSGATINAPISLSSGTTTSLNSSNGSLTTLAAAITGSGNLAKSGTDTYLLSAANTYSGTTAISGGRLNLTNTNASAITVNSTGVLGDVLAGSTASSLTTNAGSFLALAGGTTTTAFTANSFAVAGTTSVNFDTAAVVGTTYTVVNYGAGGFTGSLASIAPAIGHGTASNTGTAIQLLYQGIAFDTWNTTSGNWDTTTANWTNAIGDSKFANGDPVLFPNPSAASTVTIASGVTVSPFSATFNNSSNAYTIAGAGAIGGAAFLIKNGTGTVNISTQQSYTGGTVVNAGVLNLSGGGGSTGTIRGTVTVYTGGTLQISTGDGFGYSTTTSNVLSLVNIVGGTLNINTTGNQTLTGAAINLTGGSITGISGSNLDFFTGSPTLNSLPSTTTSTVSGVALSPLRSASATFTVARGNVTAGTSPGIDLDISSVLHNNPATNAQLIKAGAGTLRLDAAGALSGNNAGYNVAGGTLVLGFGAVGSNIIASGATLILSGGTLSLVNIGPAATVTQTVAGLTTTANTGSQILLAGGTETLTLGALTAAGANSALNINTAAGGADAGNTLVGTGTVFLTGQTAGNAINAGFTVSDSTGFGLATVNGSNQVVRLTTTVLLPASGSSSAVNYLVNNNPNFGAGSSTLTVTASQTANSITVDTTAGSGTLTLGSGVTLGSNTWNFGGVGTNTYAVTGGTGIASGTSGGTVAFNNSNAGTVTISSPIVANGTNAVVFTGTGTTLLIAANAYSGGTVINSGTVQLGSATALGTTAVGTTLATGATLDLNGQAVGAQPLTSGGTLTNSSATAASLTGAITLTAGTNSTFGGSGAITLTGVISGSGLLAKAGSGTLTLNNSGSTFTGNLTVNAGTLNISSGQAGGTDSSVGLVSAARTIAVNAGATLSVANNNLFGGGGTALAVLPQIVVLGGTLSDGNYNILGNVTLGNGATMTSTLGTTNGYDAFEFKGGSTVTVANTNGSTAGSSIASPGINLAGSVTFNVDSVTGGGSDLTISSVVYNASADNGSVVGSFTKVGTGTLTLTGKNTFSGTANVVAGTLNLGVNGALPTAATVVLSGGALAAVAGTTNTTSGTLGLGGSSTLNLGNSSTLVTKLTFGNSSALTWNGTLSVTGYTGPGNDTSSTTTELFVGATGSGLTATQLGDIAFTGYTPTTALQLATGEVVPIGAPVPEPATIFGLAAAALGLVQGSRRTRKLLV